jgi:hypothetical protein
MRLPWISSVVSQVSQRRSRGKPAYDRHCRGCDERLAEKTDVAAMHLAKEARER